MIEMNYKELAFSYFRGDITTEDERVLNAWVKEDGSNAAQLREWEKEWLGSESDAQADQWARMLGRIAVRQTVEEGQMRLDHPSPRRWGTIAAVASMLRHSLGLEQEADCVVSALKNTLDAGWRTPDMTSMGDGVNCYKMLQLVSDQINLAGELLQQRGGKR